MIILYVNSHESVCDLNEADLRLMPSDLTRYFKNWMDLDDNMTFKSVTVYTDTLINWCGEQIENGVIPKDFVQVVVNGETFAYDSDGLIEGKWPHGIFNYGYEPERT